MVIMPSPCSKPDIRGTRAVILNAHAAAHRHMTIQEPQRLRRRRFGCVRARCEERESDPQGRRDVGLDASWRKEFHVGKASIGNYIQEAYIYRYDISIS